MTRGSLALPVETLSPGGQASVLASFVALVPGTEYTNNRLVSVELGI